MKKSNVYTTSGTFKLRTAIVFAALFFAAVELHSRLLVIIVGAGTIAYIFYRVLTDPFDGSKE